MKVISSKENEKRVIEIEREMRKRSIEIGYLIEKRKTPVSHFLWRYAFYPYYGASYMPELSEKYVKYFYSEQNYTFNVLSVIKYREEKDNDPVPLIVNIDIFQDIENNDEYAMMIMPKLITLGEKLSKKGY